jgi:hypothetical protein
MVTTKSDGAGLPEPAPSDDERWYRNLASEPAEPSRSSSNLEREYVAVFDGIEFEAIPGVYETPDQPYGYAWEAVADRPDTYPADDDGNTVEELLGLLNEYQALNDAGHIWFTLGVAVSAALTGDPLWGMPVGAPSSGKTEAIRLCDYLAVFVDELTAASLLNWYSTGKGNNRKQEPSGILLRMNKKQGERQGFLTIGDFSTVLAMSDRGSRDQLFANLRRVYDGHLSRDVANAPGPLVWEGRCTILAGCTSAIDNYSAHADQLGPRWVYYRLRSRAAKEKRDASRMKRAKALEIESYRKRAQELARQVILDAREAAPGVVLPESFGDELDNMAIVACLGRGSVPRSGYGTRDIIGVPEVEEPPRLVGQLTLLAQSLRALGMDESDTLALCRRVALDSMPEVRRRVLDVIVKQDNITPAAVGRWAECAHKVARMTLEDLAALGLATSPYLENGEEEDYRFGPHPFTLFGADAELVRAVFLSDRWER